MWQIELNNLFKFTFDNYQDPTFLIDYKDLQKEKYLAFVLNDVLNIPNMTKPNDAGRWSYVFEAIKKTKDYWENPKDFDKNQIEEMALSSCERSNFSPRFACLAAAKSFTDIVDATKFACQAWANNDSIIIEINESPVCPPKWEALHRYAEFFKTL